MFAAFLLAMLVAWRLDAFRLVFTSSSEPLGVVLGAAIIFTVGLLDDLYEWSAPAKVSGMVLAGGVMSLLGITMFYFRIPFFGLVLLSPDLAPLVTVLWVVGMANAVNLIDGLDGLAAGTVAIAAGAFFLYAQRLNDAGLLAAGSISPMVSVIVLGMCVGFLPHNFHPARIFMGDCGALLLGLLMAASTIVVGGRASEPFSGQTYFFFAPLFIPLFILGVPILDTMFAIIRRATRRRWGGDRRQGPLASPADAPRPRPSAQRVHPLDVDGDPVGVRPLPDVRAGGRRDRPVRCRGARPRSVHAVPPRSAPGQGRLNSPRLACADQVSVSAAKPSCEAGLRSPGVAHLKPPGVHWENIHKVPRRHLCQTGNPWSIERDASSTTDSGMRCPGRSSCR